jgi:hypothetical protein
MTKKTLTQIQTLASSTANNVTSNVMKKLGILTPVELVKKVRPKPARRSKSITKKTLTQIQKLASSTANNVTSNVMKKLVQMPVEPVKRVRPKPARRSRATLKPLVHQNQGNPYVINMVANNPPASPKKTRKSRASRSLSLNHAVEPGQVPSRSMTSNQVSKSAFSKRMQEAKARKKASKASALGVTI